jgi:MoaA/NifB/PqqE/SkfB family radical SAM enzyme
VVDNIKNLVAIRKKRGARTPQINLQYLVWKENYKTIPEMYRLAREMEVDTILFNGLAFLSPEQQMTPAETDEMMGLYEEVVRIDEYRKISVINSFEQDLTERVNALNSRLAAERNQAGTVKRAARFLLRGDYTLAEKIAHYRKRASLAKTLEANKDLESYCLIGWHSMLVRTTGTVAPCCILQGKELGNVYKQSIRDVWHGETYRQFRAELSRIMREGPGWKSDPSDKTVDGMCAAKNGCPISTFYYWPDVRFMHSFNESLKRLEAGAA